MQDKFINYTFENINEYNEEINKDDSRLEFINWSIEDFPPCTLIVNFPANLKTEPGFNQYISQHIPEKFKDWLTDYEKYKMDLETFRISEELPHQFNEFQKERINANLRMREKSIDALWSKLNEGFLPYYEWNYLTVKSDKYTHILYLSKARMI